MDGGPLCTITGIESPHKAPFKLGYPIRNPRRPLSRDRASFAPLAARFTRPSPPQLHRTKKIPLLSAALRRPSFRTRVQRPESCPTKSSALSHTSLRSDKRHTSRDSLSKEAGARYGRTQRGRRERVWNARSRLCEADRAAIVERSHQSCHSLDSTR